MDQKPKPGIGEWVPEGVCSGRDRYVRTGSYGETIVMTWSGQENGA